MRTNEKNKGFSLVELIVVMAIMAILAVTLAPKLTHYIEKARKASDQEVINTILSTTALSLSDDVLNAAFKTSPTAADATSTNFPYTLNLEDADAYAVTDSGKKWTISTIDVSANAFVNELKTVIGDFNLKSNLVDGSTEITIVLAQDNSATVTLDYKGDGYSASEGDYQIK